MKNAFFTLIVGFFLMDGAQAHLGETLEQCGQRYGDPYLAMKDSVIYKKNGFEIGTLFVDGNVEGVTYKKENKDGIFAEKISLEEIYQILKSNYPDSPFQPKQQPTKYVFISSDNNVYADYDLIKHVLVIMTLKGKSAIDQGMHKKAETTTGGL